MSKDFLTFILIVLLSALLAALVSLPVLLEQSTVIEPEIAKEDIEPEDSFSLPSEVCEEIEKRGGKCPDSIKKCPPGEDC